MKKAILPIVLAFGLFLSFSSSNSLSAQIPGGGNGNSQNQVQGQIPMQTVVKVLKVAKDHFNESLGTLISGYCSGSCKVDKVGISNSGDGIYKVEYGGGQVIILIDGGG